MISSPAASASEGKIVATTASYAARGGALYHIVTPTVRGDLGAETPPGSPGAEPLVVPQDRLRSLVAFPLPSLAPVRFSAEPTIGWRQHLTRASG